MGRTVFITISMKTVLACVLLLAVNAFSAQVDSYESALLAAIHHFARVGEVRHLQALLERHPKLLDRLEQFPAPRKPMRTDGFTPLQTAVWAGNEEAAACLLRQGANVNAADASGWTALHMAAYHSNLGLVRLLVQSGAKQDARTIAVPEYFGVPPSSPPDAKPQRFPAIPSRTPLEMASAHNHPDVAAYLKTLSSSR